MCILVVDCVCWTEKCAMTAEVGAGRRKLDVLRYGMCSEPVIPIDSVAKAISCILFC